MHRQAEALASSWERQPARDRVKLIRNLLAAVVDDEAIRISIICCSSCAMGLSHLKSHAPMRILRHSRHPPMCWT